MVMMMMMMMVMVIVMVMGVLTIVTCRCLMSACQQFSPCVGHPQTASSKSTQSRLGSDARGVCLFLEM
jgi:heme/copper-type cytochrome/quinol oxidase subunit 2